MKFTIITPALNSARYLRETIMSVLAQKGDFDIEYILQDGGSTDETLSIWEQCRAQNTNLRISMQAYSEKDAGMYDALNRGFARTSGDILAYLNSDDLYLPGTLAALAQAFAASPDIVWVKGRSSVIDEHGKVQRVLPFMHYKQEWICRGIYGRYAPFIQQESIFWRRSLWQKAGPFDATLRYAGDYKLWISFAAHAPLVSINYVVSAFRRHSNQLSAGDGYRREQALVLPPGGTFLEWRVKVWYWLRNKISV